MEDGRRRKASTTRNGGRTAPRLSLRVAPAVEATGEDPRSADSADRGSSPVASTAGATRSDRRGAVLPPFLVVLAFLLRPSSIHKSRSRSWPSVEARDLAPPDVRSRRARLFGSPASYVETLRAVAPYGWSDSSLLPRRNDRKSATNGYT